MPLVLSDRGVNALIAHYERKHNFEHLLRALLLIGRFLKTLLGLQLLQQIFPFLHVVHIKGIARNGVSLFAPITAYKAREADAENVSDGPAIMLDTVVAIEADERTPLLVDSSRQRTTYTYGGLNGDSSNKNVNTDVDAVPLAKSAELKKGICDLRLTLFATTLFAGLVIALYLLIIEARLPVLRFSLVLVNHGIWSTLRVPLEGLLNHSNVVNVMITHTGGENCVSPESCFHVLQKLQTQAVNGTELPYNFVIGGDELTYEVRGWDYESGFAGLPQNTSLVIALIGTYTNVSPSDVQMKSLLSLLRESIRRQKLQRQYRVFGLRNTTISEWDAAALCTRIAHWPRYNSLLQIT